MQEFFTLYFRQRQRQSIKWVTLYANIVTLLGTFWPLVQEVAPGTDSLHLDHAAWDDLYDRLSLRNDGSERIGADATRSEIRMLYTDIQQWAVLNPALWQRYVASCPWGKELARGQRREKRTRKSRMDSKTREQTLTVNALRTAARQNWLHSSGLLAAAREVGPGDTFAHHGIDYTRVVAEGKHRRSDQQVMPLSVRDADGQLIRVSLDEDKDFWAYVLIEVLYQTGIRIEEALEICVQSIENWQSATGFAMPVLRIAPSKMDKERLVPLSPEALAVLAQASARLKKQHNGQVPLVPAVDGHERTDLPALAYLFQRAPFGQSVRIGYSGVAGIFRRVVKVGNVRDASGHRVHFTPHDFRRLFVSRTVNSGLPIQVAQVICGHDSITTTQGYFAIDEDRAMLAYKKYLQAQRQERPAEEYAPPSEADVAAGQNFIARRQVRLGRCDRGHGQDCERGHQCVACPALRLNDDAEPLLAAEAAASQARLLDAEKDGFLCEAEGLRERLQAIQDTRESLAVREEIRSAGPGEDPNTFTSVTTT